MSTELTPSLPRGDATRDAIIVAAIHEFAKSGFEGASTRTITEAASANQAMISYHFGGKQGLYLAVFEHIITKVEERVGLPLAHMDQLIATNAGYAAGLSALNAMIDAMVATFSRTEAGPWAQLILREQQAPTQAFDLVYEGFMRRMTESLVSLVKMMVPARADDEARLLVFTILGQIMSTRMARASLLRLMNWDEIGPMEAAALGIRIKSNVAAILAQSGEVS
jgi:TetR/AcrR family transcriptional regulator, regulator of cefoperazone and chloramphenicol sensitivity